MCSAVNKTKAKLGSPVRKNKKDCKKLTKLLNIGENASKVQIPSVNDFTDDINNTSLDDEVDMYDKELEAQLMKYGYIGMSTVLMKDEDGNVKNKYVKAINKMGQKVYIHIDDLHDKNFDCDLTLVETKQGSILPYGVKTGAMKLAGLDVSGVAFECQDNNMCMLENVMNDNDENMSIVESNFTFLEERTIGTVVENYGCFLNYPVVKWSEIKVNNALVLEGTNIVTRKLRNHAFKAYNEDLMCLQESINCMQKSFADLVTLFEQDAIKLTETLSTLEKWNMHYQNNPPCEPCDIQKSNLIVHNMRIRNDYIGYLICAMKKVASSKDEIDKLTANMNEFRDFFDEQFASLDTANNI